MMFEPGESFYDDEQVSEESSEEESSSGEEESSEEEVEVDPNEEAAEQEIEGDFDRIIQGIRGQDAASGAAVLSKDWDFNFAAEKDAEFKDDLREASGVGRKRKKKSRGTGPVLSQQVKALIGEGNQAYIDNNTPEAIRIMREVIRIEPRAPPPWTVLAQCYDDIGERETALKLRVMAAHLRHDAEEWDRLARHSRELGHNQQALYCYRKVNSLDPSNVDAYWDRASLAKELGDFKTAKHAFLAILKRFPHDMTVLRELHPILVELNDLPTCATLLQEAFDHHQKVNAHPEGFSHLDILLLADLYNALGKYERAVEIIRRGTRWLQGRAEQRYWDMCEDDREYDLPVWGSREGNAMESGFFELDTNSRHRLAVARIKMGDVEEGKRHANAVLMEDVLDYAILFAEIADAYFEREMYADAKPIYELLGGDPATNSIYILLQIAACMRNLEQLKEAADVYEHIRLADSSNTDAKMKLAEIYEILGETRRALDLVYEVIDSRKKRKTTKEGSHEETPEPGSQALASTSLFAEEKPSAKSKAAAARAQNRLTHAQLRELEAEKEKEVIRGFKRLQELWGSLLNPDDPDGEREWLLEAEKLVDMFRETRNLYLTSRANPFRGMFPRCGKRKQRTETEADEDRMASRLQLDLERDNIARKSKAVDKQGGVNLFRGVSFDDWLRMMIQYCFVLTKRDQFDVADEILRHILVSNAYQAPDRQDSIRIALITCAISTQNYTVVVDLCRKLVTRYQFNNEPLRILLASISSGLRPTDAFITSTLQKHLFREMKLADAAVKSPEALRWNPLNKRYAHTGGSGALAKGDDGDVGDDDDMEVDAEGGNENLNAGDKSKDGSSSTSIPENTGLPTKHNPVIVTIYGQICIAAKSYQSAIFYLLHAYDYAPEDPMICLCLAIASIGRAMQRQSDNRQHLIAQGLAFLSQYRKLRGTDLKTKREVEYNFGRTFHQLGLYAYAAKHYEKVLQMSEDIGDDMYGKEAAYNLSLIYVFTGATPLAQALYRKWLSV
ncbi:hypothetical protein DFP72DRAFT_894942 [Ephemerocybe angulata]|uniref:TPR-like protein n=1 Tax=Ephemerocybe angulata TaxID=980116 RepID=A0A8H6I2K5_9AGAR|nr:hypothetical protein DFP72DRAFT_894942 [Tulosesus angulatus]